MRPKDKLRIIMMIFLFTGCVVSAQHNFKIELVKDINPNGGSNPSEFVEMDGKIYFTANDGNGRQLWVTDGTSNGTSKVSEVNVIEKDFRLTKMNSILYFLGDDHIHGKELWRSDGTFNGTYMVKNINLDTLNGFNGESHIMLVQVYNDQIYFLANDGVHGMEMWKSDGTAIGTRLLKDINADSLEYFQVAHANTSSIIFQNKLYFVAKEVGYGAEFWCTDGSDTGTYMIKDINKNGSSSPYHFYEFKNKIYFMAYDSLGYELWCSDGTDTGTVLFADINTDTIGYISSSPSYFWDYHDELYFYVTPHDPTYFPDRLAKINSQSGNVEILNVPTTVNSGGNAQYIYQDKIFYQGTSILTMMTQLWYTDGTYQGSVLVPDINAHVGFNHSFPGGFFEFEGFLIFKTLNIYEDEYHLRVYDGNADTLQTLFSFMKHQVKNSALNYYNSDLSKIVIGDYCYFTGNYNSAETELWRMYDSTKVIGVEEVIAENIHQAELYPNPSGNSFVTLKYELSQTGNVTLQLYDVSGRWIRTIKDQKQTQGNHQIEIRLADLLEGVYFIQLQTPQGQQTLKLIRTNP